MPNLAPTATLATSDAFRARVTAAIVAAALDIAGEAIDTASFASVPGAALAAEQRQQLATQVLAAPEAYVTPFAWATAANPTIAAAGEATSDGDIEYTITTVWDDIAGASATRALSASA